MEFLNFEENEKYRAKLERWQRREEIHKEHDKRAKKKALWDNYKTRRLGRKPIG